MKSLLVTTDGTIIEASRTGVTVECETTGERLELFHFKSSAPEISGLVMGKDFNAVSAAYTEGRFTQVDRNFKPSAIIAEQYERAKLAGMQGLPMSAEVASSYTLVGTYLSGIESALADNLKSMEELASQFEGRPKQLLAHPEYAELTKEIDTLDRLQDTALEARKTIMSDSLAYKMGYAIQKVPPAVVESSVQVQNYMLGLYARQSELEEAITLKMGDMGEAANQLELIAQRYDDIDALSTAIAQQEAQIAPARTRQEFGL